MNDPKDCSKLRGRGSLQCGLNGVEGGLEGGTKTNRELEQEEGDRRPDKERLWVSGTSIWSLALITAASRFLHWKLSEFSTITDISNLVVYQTSCQFNYISSLPIFKIYKYYNRNSLAVCYYTPGSTKLCLRLRESGFSSSAASRGSCDNTNTRLLILSDRDRERERDLVTKYLLHAETRVSLEL